jgi:putative ABC transport system substrate-binding protein
MDRRTISTAMASCAVAVPAWAQQQGGRVYRIGMVANAAPLSEIAGPEPRGSSFRAFVYGLRALGYVEGQNLVLERRSAEGRYERFADIATDLVNAKVDVILSASDSMTRAARAASTTIPIVMTVGGDPVTGGLVQSLARPGGNVTGLTFQVGPEIDAKRLELFRELIPGASRMAFLANSAEKNWEASAGKSVRAAARTLGVTLLLAEAVGHDYRAALAAIPRDRVDALFIARSAYAYVNRNAIIDFAHRSRLPTSFDNREFIEHGGLMSYGANPAHNFARAAIYVDKILKGAHPGELPIEQPTKYEFVVNLKTAKALGLTLPQSILLRADELVPA